MSEEIKPALTAEEWERAPWRVDCGETTAQLCEDSVLSSKKYVGPPHARETVSVFQGDGRHKLAALALYGQPYGFDWSHIDSLRMMVDFGRGLSSHGLGGAVNAADEAIARLIALLPPRDVK